MSEQVLVTGASGFIGRNLVAALVARGRPVRAMVRTEEGAERVRDAAGAPGAAAAEIVFGDMADVDSLGRAATGCDLVFHLAGDYKGSGAEMWAVHRDGTDNLLTVLEPDSRLVYVSSTSVYGWDRLWPVDETMPPQPSSEYGKAKLAAEGLVQSWHAGTAVIARPTIVYGVGDTNGMPARVVRLLRQPAFRFPGNGQNRVHLTHVDDLVDGLVRLSDAGEGVFVLAGPESAPVSKIFGLLADGAELPRPRFGLPTSLLRAGAAVVEGAWSVAELGGEPPVTRHTVDVATRDREYSFERARRELGWEPRVTLEEGLPAVGAWAAGLAGVAARAEPSAAARKSSVTSIAGNVQSNPSLGFDWRSYVDDPDEGLGTVYERFALRDVLESAVERTGAQSVLHAPLFGMMGFPGIDAVFLAQRGMRVGLLDFDADRMDAVVAEWRSLGLDPETHLLASADPNDWPDELPLSYDLVFSFAALWWFEEPWAVLEAQARWAQRGVLSCVPNKNVFMRMRASLWHRGLFEQLNEEALDRHAQTRAGAKIGLQPVDTALFDIPPFPDTSVPLAKVLRAALGKGGNGAPAEGANVDAEEGAWAWSILPYLHGEQPELEDKVAKLARWERFLPAPVAPALAHHRYTLFLHQGAEIPTNS